MKAFKKVFNRLTLTIFLLVVQVLLVYFLLSSFVSLVPIVSAFSVVLDIFILLGIIKKDEIAAYKIGWIIIILVLPIFGCLLYLLLGSNLMKDHMRQQISLAHDEATMKLSQDMGVLYRLREQDERVAGCFQYAINSSYPVYENTDTEYYSFGEYMFKDMLEELNNARQYIWMEFFIINENSGMWDQVFEIISRKAKEGVDVRLIYDDAGSMNIFTPQHAIKLRELGIKVVVFNPFMPLLSAILNYRDHRKIMVVDGHTAFSGGINIADEYINEDHRLGVWKDTGLRIRGKAIQSYRQIFLETWNAFCLPHERVENDGTPDGDAVARNGFVLPYAAKPLQKDSLGENIYLDIVTQAKRYLYIFTPYLIISDKMIGALQLAAMRGVDVRIVTPGIPDKNLIFRLTRSHYKYLINAGVKIYEFTPGFLHAKSFLCDDDLAVVGTINLDYRSLYLHFECATLLYKTDSLSKLKEDTLNTIAESRLIDIKDCKRGFFSELIDSILHIFAPLL